MNRKASLSDLVPAVFEALQQACHEQARKSGFYDGAGFPAPVPEEITEAFPEFANRLDEWIRTQSLASGYYPNGRNVGEAIALIHSELSEALEAVRDTAKPSAKIPDYSCVEEEFADTIIRLADLAEYLNLDLGGAILAKMQYNAGRPRKHGRNF